MSSLTNLQNNELPTSFSTGMMDDCCKPVEENNNNNNNMQQWMPFMQPIITALATRLLEPKQGTEPGTLRMIVNLGGTTYDLKTDTTKGLDLFKNILEIYGSMKGEFDQKNAELAWLDEKKLNESIKKTAKKNNNKNNKRKTSKKKARNTDTGTGTSTSTTTKTFYP